MATRPALFGLRLRDKGRTVRVRADRRGYVVEDQRADGSSTRRQHGSARSAVKDAARTWRHRLH